MTERAIFEAAIEINDIARRVAFLDEACSGDAALRQRLDVLLASHDKVSQFLNTPAIHPVPASGDETSSQTTMMPKSDTPQAGEDDKDDSERNSGSDLNFLLPSSKPGSIGLLGHYEILQILGQGAFGVVFKAFDEKLHRMVAIKVMNPALAATSPPRKRFLREARSSAAVRHENIVAIHAVEEQPVPYLVMEYIPGKTLQQWLDEHGPLDPVDVLKFGLQIARGLVAAHAQGLIHRDIKPANILIDTSIEVRIKITDFGLARAVDDASMTQSGLIAGTPMYMAPEQARGQMLDHRADLFSLGSVLYTMASGRPPFRASNTIAVLKRVCEDTPRPVSEVIPGSPKWLDEIIAKLHAKEPDDRFQSAKEVSDLLARYLIQPPPSSPALDSGHGVTGLRSPVAPRQERQAPESVARPESSKGVELQSTTPFTKPQGVPPDASKEEDLRSSPSAGSGDPRTASKLTAKPIMLSLLLAMLALTPILFGRHFSSAFNNWLWPPIPTLPATEIATGLRFDGKDDYVKVGPIDLSAPQYTLEAFVTSAKDGDNGVIALLKNIEKAPESMYLYDGYPGGQRQSGAAIIGQRPYQSVNAPLPSGARQHRALVFDGSAMHYYVNGIWQGKRYCTARKGLMWEMRELYIGCKATETEFFRGQIDQLRLSKIARYYNNFTVASKLTSDDSTLALYNFDEGSGDVLKDSSGNSHDGKIVGAEWVKATELPVVPMPAMPKSVSDVLPFLAGAWKVETRDFDSTLTPEKALSVAEASFDPVANGRVIAFRARGACFYYSLDPAGDSVRLWYVDNNGRSVGPVRGVFDARKRSVLWRQPLDNDKEFIHEIDFNNVNEMSARVFHRDVKANATHKINYTYTRAFGAIPPVQWADDPNRSEQMIVLDQLVGEWRNEITVTDGGTPDKPKQEVFRATAGLLLGGRFVEMTETNEATGSSDYTLAWFDPAVNQYREWFFHGAGFTLQFHGLWDEAAKTLTWHSSDNRLEGRWIFKGGDLREFRHITKAIDGKTLSDAAGISRRATTTTAPLAVATSKSHQWPADAPKPAIAPFDAEQAKQHQAAWAKYLNVPVEYENSIGMKFVLIPPGEFMMGSTQEEAAEVLRLIEQDKNAKPGMSHWADPRWEKLVRSELPQHRVVLTQPFYLGQHEVTQQHYQSIAGTNPSTFRAGGAHGEAVAGLDTAMFPVSGMSWEDAAEFCIKLSAKEKLKPNYFRAAESVTILDGQGYRLPTEAEWEFACRAGTTTKYFSGNNVDDLHQVGWSANSGGRPHAVGELKPSPFGLYDIHGNVWEWCQDWWDPEYYSQFRERPAIDPICAIRPKLDETYRVSRGADWFFSGAHPCRSSLRMNWGPRHHWFGFRTALSVDAVRQAIKVERSNGNLVAEQGHSAWDDLDPAQIPEVERVPNQPEGLVAVLGQHRRRVWNAIRSSSVSPDGTQFLLTTDDGLHLFGQDPKQPARFFNFGIAHPSATFLPDGRIAAFVDDGVAKGTQLQMFAKPRDGASLEKQTATTSQNPEAIYHATASSDGRWVAGFVVPGSIGLWRLGDTPPQRAANFVLRATDGNIPPFSFSPDAKWFSFTDTTQGQGTIHLIDLRGETPHESTVLKAEADENSDAPAKGFEHAAFLSDGRLATADRNGRIWFWKINDSAPQRVGSIRETGISIRPAAQALRLVVQTDHTVLKVWNLATDPPQLLGRSSASLRVDNILTFAISPNGETIFTGHLNGAVRFWNVSESGLAEIDPLLPNPKYKNPYSQQLKVVDRFLCSSMESTRVGIWRPTRDGLQALPEQSTSAFVLDASAAQQQFIVRESVHGGGTALLRCDTDRVTPTRRIGVDLVESAALNDEGNRLAIGRHNGTEKVVELWGWESENLPAKKLTEVKSSPHVPVQLAFADAGRVLIGRVGLGVQIWDVNEDQLIPRTSLPPSPSQQTTTHRKFDLAPDGLMLATVDDVRLGLWNLKSDLTQPTTSFTISGTNAVAFSPDGRRLAASFWENGASAGVQIINLATGVVEKRLTFPGQVPELTFTDDSRHLITGNGNATIYVVRLQGPPSK